MVFLGDFWHHRHSLQVRHVDRCVHLSALHCTLWNNRSQCVCQCCVCVCVCGQIAARVSAVERRGCAGHTHSGQSRPGTCELNPYTWIVVAAGLTGRTTGERGRARARDQHVWSLSQHFHRNSAHLRCLQSPGLPSLVTRVIRTPPLLLHSSFCPLTLCSRALTTVVVRREDSAEQQRQFAHVRELEPLVDLSSSEQTPGKNSSPHTHDTRHSHTTQADLTHFLPPQDGPFSRMPRSAEPLPTAAI